MRIKLALAVAVIAATALGSTTAAQGAIVVANQNDSGAGSLRQAVADAGPGETIAVPAGDYALTSAPLTLTKPVTIAGHAAGDTTIRSAGAFGVMVVTGAIDVAINGVTIRDSKAVEPGGIAQGGGIDASGAGLSLSGVVLTNNLADAGGAAGKSGGIAQGGGLMAASVILDRSVVSNNTANAGGGDEKAGGIAEGGGIFSGTIQISNSVVNGNTASARGGQKPEAGSQSGGIAQGGGIFAVHNDPTPESIIASTISGNVGDVSAGPGGTSGIVQGGGAFLNMNAGLITLARATVAGNVVRSSASGGIYQGGGMFLGTNAPGTATIDGATVSGNRIEAMPGATTKGANIFFGGTVEGTSIGNSIFSGGSGSSGSDNCAGSPNSLGFNLESLDECGFEAPGDKVKTGPQLGPLQSNGGPTPTMAPALSSPAVDQGRAFGATADQRGLTRPVDLAAVPNSLVLGADGADIGAVELQAPPVPPVQLLSNAFKLGKVTKNRKKGRARIQVILPQPSAGTLTLAGKALQKQTLTIKGEGQVSVSIVGNKNVRKALRKSGKRKVKLEVTYTPTGTPAATQSRTVNLVKKKKPKRKGRK